MSIHLLRHVLVVLLALTMAACGAVPGFQRTNYEGSSEWYGKDDPDAAEPLDLDPQVHRITPELLEQLIRDPVPPPFYIQQLPENAAKEPYRIGVGDLLGVVVYGHPDITNPAGLTQSFESSGRVVDAAGEIFIPFAGALQVAGLTTTEARQLVASSLKRVINDPQVDIRVLNFRSQRIFVTGDIERPCTVWIEDIPLTIVDALRSCESDVSGFQTVGGRFDSVRLIRDGKSYLVNLMALYRTGGGPVELQNGDRLIVDNRLNRVFVVGEFETQMAVSVSAGGMTLADAMAAAGGLDLENADTGAIFVIRGVVDADGVKQGTGEDVLMPKVYHLDARAVDALILADQFRLWPRDVVYAAPARLVNFNRALAQITPSIDALFRTAVIYDVLTD